MMEPGQEYFLSLGMLENAADLVEEKGMPPDLEAIITIVGNSARRDQGDVLQEPGGWCPLVDSMSTAWTRIPLRGNGTMHMSARISPFAHSSLAVTEDIKGAIPTLKDKREFDTEAIHAVALSTDTEE